MNLFENFFENYINEVGERRGIHSNVLNVYLEFGK